MHLTVECGLHIHCTVECGVHVHLSGEWGGHPRVTVECCVYVQLTGKGAAKALNFMAPQYSQTIERASNKLKSIKSFDSFKKGLETWHLREAFLH